MKKMITVRIEQAIKEGPVQQAIEVLAEELGFGVSLNQFCLWAIIEKAETVLGRPIPIDISEKT